MVWIFFKVSKNKLNKLADYYEIQYKANNFEENINQDENIRNKYIFFISKYK